MADHLQPHRRPARPPAFHPVPLRDRKDGWAPIKQAEFIGYLAETRSVAKAARLVGRSRESAYRLRRKPGAEGFAAAWDIVMGRRFASDMTAVVRAARKVTPGLLWEHALSGKVKPVMRSGTFRTVTKKPDNSALLQHLAQLDRTCARIEEEERGRERSHY
ncbi:helix-turn-helix domain-containing protein [Pontixanthobacter aquaemixtae]|uniref:Uncharacterized protein n=1 Tax=Pontixanthobacter aquaemixtae TaxID=1958940 RepID=A0A844ZVW8_9SPHN|nr:helix-turn-helix domain-containing protein [Pontixanthobacter aquaemixtae]MXO91096.1 hypothetical protein [Pontixanthobacter aquaemixtae]